MERLSGLGKSIFEVCVTISLTFVPFLLLSFKWLETDGSNTSGDFLGVFFGYWQAGEIVLPILGLCGAVTALLALNKGYFEWWTHAIVSIFILVCVLGSGSSLIKTDGFTDELNSQIIITGFFVYGALAFIWIWLASTVRTTEPTTRQSDATDIINKANARRNDTGSQS